MAGKRAPTIPRPELPVTVGAALLGLFGNDDAKYGQDGVGHIETNQIFAKKDHSLPRGMWPSGNNSENS